MKFHDVANGQGIRLSLYTQGCMFRCKECFNSDTHSYADGKEWTSEEHDQIINHLSNTHITGLSILGGEPLSNPNKEALRELLNGVRKVHGNSKNIWLWTGRLFEDIKKDPEWSWILRFADVIIDGRFELDKKDFKLQWRGSSNQRVIDVKETLNMGEVILYAE